MTVTIPTSELVGALADVIPFACAEDELPTINCVRIEWDGQQLHALATDMFRVAISSWDPDDAPDEDVQDDLFTSFGSGDDPWHLLVPLSDAKDLVKVFKLPPKEGRAALTVDVDNGRLAVRRSRESGHSALTATIDGTGVEFPDVRKLLAKNDVIQPARTLAFTARFMADFAKVRPRGPLLLTFTGDASLVHVAIGERFVGAIVPTRLGSDG